MNVSTFIYSTILFLNGIDKNSMPRTCNDVAHAKAVIKTAVAITGYKKDPCYNIQDKLTDQFIILNCKLPAKSKSTYSLFAKYHEQAATAQRHEYCPKLAAYLFHNKYAFQLNESNFHQIPPSYENIKQQYTQLECSQHGDVYITSSCKKSNAVTIDLNLDIKDL